jgi:DNA-binding winged helix-turn-helix (wHTH) protein/Tol biopolymer transport system component
MVEYRFGPFRVDVASLQLWRGDDVVSITPKAFDTLLVLLRNRHRLVRKDELIHAVWTNSFVSEDSLTQNITALRRALGDDPQDPSFISTIPRRGYRFIAPVVERPVGKEPAASPAPAGVEAAAVAPVPAPRRWTPVWIALAAAAAGIAGLVTVLDRPAPPPDAGPLRFTVGAPPGTRLSSGGALSPDSRRLAFVARDEAAGTTRLWVQVLEDGRAEPLEGTEGASKPFWSPDSQSIGFFAGGRVKRVPTSGGPVQTLASTVGLSESGGAWGANDVILFAGFRSAINAVPAAGGPVTTLTELDAAGQETAHRWPQFLPDGRFVFSVYAERSERIGTYVGSFESKERTRLVGDVGGIYAPPGFLLFVRDRVLMAQPLDAATAAVTGSPAPIAADVFAPYPNTGAALSASAGNLLAFGGRAPQVTLAWFDRAGQPVGTVDSPVTLFNPSLSNDERYLLAGTGTDIWLVDLQRDAPTRLGPGNTPLLSPDGAQLAFTSGRTNGIADIYTRSTLGRSEDHLVLRTPENKIVNDWSRDGRYLVYASTSAETKMDLWVMPTGTSGGSKPAPLLVSAFNEFQAQISPDGRWIAYASDESGRWEVYVQAFPGLGAKRAISAGGGSEPQWRRDGRELFYLSDDGVLMSVDVTPGEPLQVSRPTTLFRTPIPIAGEMYTRRNHYIPDADGRRFLLTAASDAQEAITVLVNWTARLRR